jgi:predicted nucleotidyltransferase
MALPVVSVRARPEYRDLLQKVADLVRAGHGDALRRVLADIPGGPVGPFRSEAAAIAFIRDKLVADLRPLMLWVFGSRARGDARPDSDFDILVVLPDGLPPEAYTHQAVAAPLVASGLAFDIVPCSLATFEVERSVPGTLVHTVVTEGKLLWGRPPWRSIYRRPAPQATEGPDLHARSRRSREEPPPLSRRVRQRAVENQPPRELMSRPRKIKT